MWQFKNIETYEDGDDISFNNYNIAYHGDFNLDERGRFVDNLLTEKQITNKIYLKYNEQKYCFETRNKTIRLLELENELRSENLYETLVIDATSLSFAELLYLLNVTNNIELVKDIQILYVEPKEYRFVNNSITTYDEFSLSDKLQRFPPLPGFTINTELEKVELIAFLGFEKQRLGQIFSSEEVIYEKFTPVVPLPGFLPGWENRTINNHLKFFDPKYFFSEIQYVAANNPYQSLKLLEKMAKTRKSFRVAPIGTKPNAIGCAVFLVNNAENQDDEKSIGALYDFPVKSVNRSEGIGKIHIYNLIKT